MLYWSPTCCNTGDEEVVLLRYFKGEEMRGLFKEILPEALEKLLLSFLGFGTQKMEISFASESYSGSATNMHFKVRAMFKNWVLLRGGRIGNASHYLVRVPWNDLWLNYEKRYGVVRYTFQF